MRVKTLPPPPGRLVAIMNKPDVAMKPKKEFKDKPCSDQKKRPVETFIISTPIGNMLLKACNNGLHMINQVEEISDENFNPLPEQTIAVIKNPVSNKAINDILQASILWLNTYFFEPENIGNVPLPSFCTVSEGGKFHDQVQLTLAKQVGFGRTISYKELASLTSSPGAFQAVGSAMRSNPFQLMVPCHRVINSGSKLGAYSGGRRNKTKEWLLNHEGLKVVEGIVKP